MPTALVTGSNRGIGLDVCRQLHERGVTVIATSRAGKPHPYGTALALDITDPASIQHAAQQVAEQWGKLDILINNAGISLDQGQSIIELRPETLQETLNTNLFGALQVSQAMWDLLADNARIINVSSVSGQLSNMGQWVPGYAISKTALNAVTVQLSLAGKKRGIIVNSVCPGWTQTDMGGARATRTVAEGAEGIVWLALDAPATLNGAFVRDHVKVEW